MVHEGGTIPADGLSGANSEMVALQLNLLLSVGATDKE
jgi:hypothetical protein